MSSRRSEDSIERLNKVLISVGLSPIHDSTPEVKYNTSIAFSRTEEIQSWLEAHQEQAEEDDEKRPREMKWIALDDMHLGKWAYISSSSFLSITPHLGSCASSLPFFQGLCHHFLLTNREIGITK
jgi:hypothetical protein